MIKRNNMIKAGKNLFFLSLILFSSFGASSQNFFLEDWKPKETQNPSYIEHQKPSADPSVDVTVDMADTLTKVPAYIYGNNANVYSTIMHDNAELVGDIKNLNPHVLRYPGGNLSNEFFWDRGKNERPDDIPDDIGFWAGMNKEDWTMSVDDYYTFLEKTGNTGIICVNYSYARYGLSENPVENAAHYAAEWVRYDNGRTKFWEIGNENYGNWQTGYEIDTSLNKDGQPEKISGELYGQHCRVFIDSMKAAAKEINHEIYIGVQAYKTETSYDPVQTDWNETMMPVVGDVADFYIVHSYYTPHQEDSDVATILNSYNKSENFKAQVYEDLQDAGYGPAPLTLTEYNIFAEGSYQQISQINGMHAAMVLGKVIEDEYGLAARWNLANGWDNGNDHGMFSRNDPEVEDFTPYPDFFYMTYFQKYFGDVMVNAEVTGSQDIVSYASSFNSGQSGIVIVNKSSNEKVVEVDINNFSYDDRYFWYTLVGGEKADGPFSRQVLINGNGPESVAGGPENYESIKAYSANAQGGVKITAPPYSVNYLLVDGNKKGNSSKVDTTKAMIQNENLGKGVNIGNWLEAPGLDSWRIKGDEDDVVTSEWGVTMKREDFTRIAEQGFNSIRIPCRWNVRTDKQKPYKIDEDFFKITDWAIDNALNNGLYAVINMHHYEPLYDNPDAEKERFLSMWRQICQHYSSYPDSLIFEILNEPHGDLTASKWNDFLKSAYDTIRKYQPNRTIVIGTANYGGVGGLNDLELPENDSNIILTVHHYQPFQFTHQGASWVGEHADDWLGTPWLNKQEERQEIENDVITIKEYADQYNVPVYMGEFGAYSKADFQDRVRWTNYCARIFEQYGFSSSYWEYSAGFGVYNPNSGTWRDGLLYALLHMPMSNPSNILPEELPMNLVTNGDFSNGKDHWYLYVDQDYEADLIMDEDTAGISIQNGGAETKDVSLINNGLYLEKDKTYQVSFRAYADQQRSIEASVSKGSDPWVWHSYSGNRTFHLTQDMKQYQFYFTMEEKSDYNGKLMLKAGNNSSDIYVSDVAVRDLAHNQDTTPYKLTVQLTDARSGEVLEDCKVTCQNQTKTTSKEGKVVFSDTQAGYYEVKAAKKHYDSLNTVVGIYSDTTLTLSMDLVNYEASVQVVDNYTGNNVSAAKVTLDTVEKVTNYTGMVSYKVPWNKHTLQVEKEGYRDTTREITIVGDTTLKVFLKKISGAVKFRIKKDGTPVNEATIEFNGQKDTTNSLGISTFENVSFDQYYDYSVSKQGLETLKDSLFLHYDTTVNLQMKKFLVNLEFEVEADGSPLENARVIIGSDTTLTSSDGITEFYDYPGNSEYFYEVKKSGYQTVSDSVYVNSDTTLQVSLTPTGIQSWLPEAALSVYPNPAGKYIFIESENIMKSLKITNLAGMPVMNIQNLHTRYKRLNLSDLQDGMYFLEIFYDENKRKIQKIILK